MTCKYKEARERRASETLLDREFRDPRRLLERMKLTAIALVLHRGKTVRWALDELASHPQVHITIGEYADLKRQVERAVAQHRSANQDGPTAT